MQLGAGSTTSYSLPAPPGHWVPGARCEVWREACGEHDSACKAAVASCSTNTTDNVNTCNPSGSCKLATANQPCNWRTSPDMIGKTVYVLPLGTHNLDYPFACAPGIRGGNGSNPSEQTSATCGGFCPAGFTCGGGAEGVEPVACPEAHYCPEGSSVALPCPAGTFGNASGLQAERECNACPVGHFCGPGVREPTPCSRGTVAPNASMVACNDCEAGMYQEEAGQTACGSCRPGSFCPVGASAPLPCRKGSHSSSTRLTNATECTPTEMGHFAPTGGTEQTKCSAGTVQPDTGKGTCLPCAAGSFMNMSGQSACFECSAGFVCAAQASAEVPCPGGTFGNNSGLRDSSECEDVPPGFFAQAGSITPTPCPSWGFCPGRQADRVLNGVPGSIPTVIPEGQRTAKVTKLVKQAMNQTVLQLPLRVEVADVDAFNDTSVRVRVADMLGLPLHAVSLSFGASGRRLDLRTARSRRLAALDLVVTIPDEPAINITSAASVWSSKGLSTLSAELGMDVTSAPSPVVAIETTIQNITVPAFELAECLAGSWGAGGECVLCSKGTFRPGGTNGTGCLECPVGMYQPFSGGSECMVCGAGNYSANTLSCEPCQMGEFCKEGSIVGERCPIGFTTKGRGAKSQSECGCYSGEYEVVSDEGNHTCEKCNPISMACNEPAITVFELPVAPGYWRQHNWSAPGQKGPGFSKDGSVLPCHTKEACLGGVDPYADGFCAPSQQGPHCAVCRDGYFGGGDGALCEPCEGYAALTFLPMVIIGIGLLSLLAYILHSCYRGKDILDFLAAESSQLTEVMAQELEAAADATSVSLLVDTAADATINAVKNKAVAQTGARAKDWAVQKMTDSMETDGANTDANTDADPARLEAAVDKRWPKMMASARWLSAKAGAFGVKLKILIALYQMLQGIGITFNIRWPEAYGDALRFLGSIVQIDLPQAMPLDCVTNFGFFGALVIRTGLPLLLIMVLASISNLFKWCSKDGTKHEKIASMLSSGCFYVLFLVYPSCCTAVFQAFMCDELDDGSAYLRVDYSVQCYAKNQGAFSEYYEGVMAYAVLMSFVYPLGTPVLYAAVLYANRDAIAKVDRLERGLWSSNTNDATLRAKVHQNIRQKALGTGGLAQLTGGYEMRVYWFEVFECARKICLIGLPIFFEPGSPGQLIVGLLVCFISFGMYASYEPYVKDSDDWLAKVAQVSLFFSLVSSIALRVESDSSTEALGVVLVFTLMVPPVAGFLFESEIDFGKECYVSYVKERAIKWFTSTLGLCFVKLLGETKEGTKEGTEDVSGVIEVVVPKTGADTPAPTLRGHQHSSAE